MIPNFRSLFLFSEGISHAAAHPPAPFSEGSGRLQRYFRGSFPHGTNRSTGLGSHPWPAAALSLLIAAFLFPSLSAFREYVPNFFSTHTGPRSVSLTTSRYHRSVNLLSSLPPSMFSFMAALGALGGPIPSRRLFAPKSFRLRYPFLPAANSECVAKLEDIELPSDSPWRPATPKFPLHRSVASRLAWLFEAAAPLDVPLLGLLGDLTFYFICPPASFYSGSMECFTGEIRTQGCPSQTYFSHPSGLSVPSLRFYSFFLFTLMPMGRSPSLSFGLPDFPIQPLDYLSFLGRPRNSGQFAIAFGPANFAGYIGSSGIGTTLPLRIDVLAHCSLRNFGASLHQSKLFNHFLFRGSRSRAQRFFEFASADIGRSIPSNSPIVLLGRRGFRPTPQFPGFSGPLGGIRVRRPWLVSPFDHIYQYSVSFLNFPFKPLLFRRGAARISVLSLERRNRDLFRFYLSARHTARGLPLQQLFGRYLLALLDVVLRPDQSIYGRVLENSYFHSFFRRMDLSRHLLRHRRRYRRVSRLPFGASVFRRSWWTAIPISPGRNFPIMRTSVRMGSGFNFIGRLFPHVTPPLFPAPSPFPFVFLTSPRISNFWEFASRRSRLILIRTRFATVRLLSLALRSLAGRIRRRLEEPQDQRPSAIRPYARLYRRFSHRNRRVGWVGPLRSLRNRLRHSVFPRLVRSRRFLL